ncbi:MULTISPECIES: DUF2850 domain-containing protein [Vibrio]|uniref:DUF2850 domain-containing protein n=1 Tax=Vibrio TaxID=662 RepID=UPI00207608EB|nr:MULTISPECIES: DUF2850 domain-containing protein [Vibrio]USD35428.1 DUF2850 domain-containing protein [Vibrio sp. SCSIO 43186]USD48499.1 DUF2850 domain-containing protein [Vibrio sp. SCSIO 43145]USD72552.1 DUF2850 domain-containing protein [Vibrio sp. SCSIO 43139]USD98427.1 hypothetical protein CTT30_20610 [Vibrio coralliilyticus]
MEKEAFLKLSFVTLLVTLAVAFSSLLFFSYQDYVHPKHVYGRWIEIGTPEYNTEVLTFNERGVYRNDRLVTTNFDFDGKVITVTTGGGISIYQVAGTFKSPQLRRLEPNSPTQRFIKAGYENTVDMSGSSGSAKNRRAALSEHFSSKK